MQHFNSILFHKFGSTNKQDNLSLNQLSSCQIRDTTNKPPDKVKSTHTESICLYKGYDGNRRKNRKFMVNFILPFKYLLTCIIVPSFRLTNACLNSTFSYNISLYKEYDRKRREGIRSVRLI
jgi:hypothetical protein